LSASESATQLSAFVNHERAILLDRLLDRATVVNAKLRPTCAEVASELAAWLSGSPPAPKGVSIPERVAARLRQLADAASQARRERDLAGHEAARVLSKLHTELVAMGEQFASAAGVPARSRRLPDGNTNHSLRYFPYNSERISHGDRSFEEYFETVGGKTIVVSACAILESAGPSKGVLTGGLILSANHRPTEYLLRREAEFRFGSAMQAAAVDAFLSELRSQLSATAERLADVLVEENSATPKLVKASV
jgi:hypothetical protein